MERRLSVQIDTINGCLLRNENELFDTLFCHRLRFCYQFLHRNGAVRSAQLRNDAVGTVLVTALCNFQIFVMAACRYNALCVNFRQSFQIGILLETVAAEDILNGIQDFVIAVRSKYGVNLRNLLNDFIAVALCHTARYQKNLTASRCTVLRHFKNILNAFFFGVVDKAACVYHDNLCIFLGIGDLETMLYQKTQHMLGIYQVFIASKGNKQNFHIIQLLAPLLFPLPLQLQIPEGL